MRCCEAIACPGLDGIKKLAHLALLAPGLLTAVLHGQFQDFGAALQTRLTLRTHAVVKTGTFAVVNDALPAKALVTAKNDAVLDPHWRRHTHYSRLCMVGEVPARRCFFHPSHVRLDPELEGHPCPTHQPARKASMAEFTISGWVIGPM